MSEHTSSSSVLDEYLVIESRLGDARAFSRLVRRWHPQLVRHAYRFTGDLEAARDVTQDAWLVIMRGLSSLRDPARFRAWAFRIVANKARDRVRREQTRRRATAMVDTSSTSSEPGVAGSAIRRLRAGLARLEPGHRMILTRFYLEEMSVHEIADSLGIPVGTVKSRLFYARNALRAVLQET